MPPVTCMKCLALFVSHPRFESSMTYVSWFDVRASHLWVKFVGQLGFVEQVQNALIQGVNRSRRPPRCRTRNVFALFRVRETEFEKSIDVSGENASAPSH